MISNHGNNKAKDGILRSYDSRFAFQDKILVVFSFLGVFDDVRQRIIEETSGKSVDWLYEPGFLFESVLVPAFNIGRVLSKANPIAPRTTKKGQNRRTSESSCLF